MKNLRSFLFSMLFTGILLVIFAISIAYATFIENDYGTITAKILIYNAWWFELLLIVMCINLIGSMFVNKLASRKKWPMFIFHIAFVVITIGAGITRYYGYEGMMHIREGKASDFIVSTEAYVTARASEGSSVVEKEKEVKFSPYTANRFKQKLHINGKDVTVENMQFITSVVEIIKADPMGVPLISVIAVTESGQREDFILKSGESKSLSGVSFGLDAGGGNTFKFRMENNILYMQAGEEVSVSSMQRPTPEMISPDTTVIVNQQNIYSIGGLRFAVQQYLQKGKTELSNASRQNGASTARDVMRTRISVGNETAELNVFGKKSNFFSKRFLSRPQSNLRGFAPPATLAKLFSIQESHVLNLAMAFAVAFASPSGAASSSF